MNQQKSHDITQKPLFRQGDEIRLTAFEIEVDAVIKRVILINGHTSYSVLVQAWPEENKARAMILGQELLVQLFEPVLA